MPYLTYISDADLYSAVSDVFQAVIQAQKSMEIDLNKNVIDPFSALFDATIHQSTLEEWGNREKRRQIQKTLQNKIGEFHETILASVKNWEKLPKGFDLINRNRKILAEIKNKYNTVKSSDKVSTYDYLDGILKEPLYEGYTAYYVEIVPDKKQPYNQIFTPSDRKNQTRRPANPSIRRISGQAFYDLVTEEENALEKLFDVLPDVISDIAGLPKLNSQAKNSFKQLFNNAYLSSADDLSNSKLDDSDEDDDS